MYIIHLCSAFESILLSPQQMQRFTISLSGYLIKAPLTEATKIIHQLTLMFKSCPKSTTVQDVFAFIDKTDQSVVDKKEWCQIQSSIILTLTYAARQDKVCYNKFLNNDRNSQIVLLNTSRKH